MAERFKEELAGKSVFDLEKLKDPEVAERFKEELAGKSVF